MKSKSFIMFLAVAAFACGLFIVTAQEPDDDVRGAFLSSRPKTTNTNATRKPRPPRNTNSNTGSTVAKNANTSRTNVNANIKVVVNANNSASGREGAIGLGYTLFMRDLNGRGIRVDPGREFHNGDRVRFSLEPNVDGYLYVFHTEGGGAPEMIYPDPRLDGGENWIEAHVPVEVPSSGETDERLRWFTFYGDAGIERLYVVVSREPLPLVPTGDDLVNFCSANKCPWHPAAEVWARVQAANKAEVKVVTSNRYGQSQTEKEQVATTRGLGLDQSAPQPAVIRMSATTNAPVLVTVLDLVHK
jgi:Domain of unknown function (DUF4384)